ncbi:MAG: PEP-CTERM system histidine kinase PrsK, partial [Alphaproteobacteria bacterium]
MATIELVNAGLLGYTGAAVGYLLLTLLVTYWWKRDLSGALLIAASFATCAWAATTAYGLRFGTIGQASQILEIVRTSSWMLLPLGLLFWMPPVRRLAWASVIVGAGVAVVALTFFLGDTTSPEGATTVQMIVLIGHLALAVAGLVLVENLFRNSSEVRRWAVKYLCFGAGALFAYDFFLYSDSLLFRHLDIGLFMARGAASLFVLPLFGLYAARNRKSGPQIAVSRQFAFHSTTFVGAGLYLIAMAAAGYYVRHFGGTWTTFLQALFFFGAVLLLIVPISSSSVRAYLRVFVEKSFFQYKYDYRQEWLRFIRTISHTQEAQDLRRRVIQA